MDLNWLVHTNICIYIAKHLPPEVARRFAELKVGQVGMSVVTYCELYNGAIKSQQREIALQKLTSLIELIPGLNRWESAMGAFAAR